MARPRKPVTPATARQPAAEADMPDTPSLQEKPDIPPEKPTEEIHVSWKEWAGKHAYLLIFLCVMFLITWILVVVFTLTT